MRLKKNKKKKKNSLNLSWGEYDSLTDDGVALLDLGLPVIVLGGPLPRQEAAFGGLMLKLRLDVNGSGGGGGGRRRGYREARRTRYVSRVRGRATSWRRAGGRR